LATLRCRGNLFSGDRYFQQVKVDDVV